jgi:hypothetical protein
LQRGVGLGRGRQKDRGLIGSAGSRSRPVMSRKPKLRILSLPANRGTRDRAQFQRSVSAQVVLLTKVFADLNGDAGPPARGLHPAGKGRRQPAATAGGGGENRDRALELVRKMESSQLPTDPRSSQESSRTGQTPGDNVEFELSALYVPELESDRGGAH